MNYDSRCIKCKKILQPVEILFNGNQCNKCTRKEKQIQTTLFDIIKEGTK